jgi:hypothetical protein
VTLDPLAGMVVVLAAPAGGDESASNHLAVPAGAELLASGALVAAVTTNIGVIDDLGRNADLHGVDAPVSWRADPVDLSTWERLYAHIEQRLGPVDAVLADPAALDVVESVFRPDMLRRGHGVIVALSGPHDPVAAIRQQLRRTP